MSKRSSSHPGERPSTSRLIRKYRLDPVTIFGIVLLLLLILTAIFAQYIVPHDPMKQNLRQRLLPPVPLSGSSSAHLLGTDSLGRDLLSNIILGLQISLKVGVAAIIIAATAGFATGMVAGYFGGIVESVLMRLVDLSKSLPSLLMALFVSVLWGRGMGKIIVIIAFTVWGSFARLVYGKTLSIRNELYIESARAIGAPHTRILLRHIFPNLTELLIVTSTLYLPWTILAEATLSFLGVGLPVGIPSLGRLVHKGQKVLIVGFWWISIFPGLILFIIVMAMNIVGDWLREYLDPRLRTTPL